MAHPVASRLPVLLVDDEPQILRGASVSLRASGIGHVLTLEDSRAVEIRALRAEVLSLKESILTDTPPQREAFEEIVTQSSAMLAIFRYVEAIASSPQPVL